MGVIKRVAVIFMIISLWCFIPYNPLGGTTGSQGEHSFEIKPRIENGQVLIPLRKVFETMGYRVEWEDQVRRITIYGREYVVVLYLDSELYSLNGTVKRMEQRLVVENGRSLVSLDLFRGLAVADDITWGNDHKTLHINYSRGEPALDEWLENDAEGRYANFIEVRLSNGEQVDIGQVFDIFVGAPFIPGIHTYEIRFLYDPEILHVIDTYNSDYRSGEDYFKKAINNNEGQASYTQTLLGYRENIPSRNELMTIRAEALQEGTVSLFENTLKVVLLDNEVRVIPISQEEVTVFFVSPGNENSRKNNDTVEK